MSTTHTTWRKKIGAHPIVKRTAEFRVSQWGRKIILGARDELARLWLREDEVKGIVENARKDYQTTFFKKEGIYRSGRGYFRLFEAKDGTKGLVFSFHYANLEREAIDDNEVAGGKRHRLMSTKDVFLVTTWPSGASVRLENILEAIGTYSRQMRKAILDETILYETDFKKGIYRSGGVAYVFEEDPKDKQLPIAKRLLHEVLLYDKLISTGSLVNPFGENIMERIFTEFDPGVPLLSVLAKKEALQNENGNDDGKKNGSKTAPPSREREEVEHRVFKHYLKASHRYLQGQDPASSDEKKWNKLYYVTKRTLQVAGSIVLRSKNRLRRLSLEKGAEITGLTGVASAILRNLILGGFIAAVISVPSLCLYGIRVLKRRIDRNALIDLRDPNVKKLSHDAELIGTFATLERPLNKEAFDQDINMLSTQAFGRILPKVKSEPSLDNWPPDLLEPSVQERGRSIIKFYFDPDVQPSQNPVKDVVAFKVLRTDGIVCVKFLNEDRIWGMYLGRSFDWHNPKPHAGLLKQLPLGCVLEINNVPGQEDPVVQHVPLAEAEEYFSKRFGRPLLEQGIKKYVIASMAAQSANATDVNQPAVSPQLDLPFVQTIAAKEHAQAAAKEITYPSNTPGRTLPVPLYEDPKIPTERRQRWQILRQLVH